jgi:hypothetical protein
MSNKCMKRCCTALVIGEMQIKPTMRCRCTPSTMATIKKRNNNKYWWGWEETGSLTHSPRTCKMVLLLRKQFGRILKAKQKFHLKTILHSKFNKSFPYNSAPLLLGKKLEEHILTQRHHGSVIQKSQRQPTTNIYHLVNGLTTHNLQNRRLFSN